MKQILQIYKDIAGKCDQKLLRSVGTVIALDVNISTIIVLFKSSSLMLCGSIQTLAILIGSNKTGKKEDFTSEFRLLAHANQSFLIIICTINSPLLELQAQKHVEVQYGDWSGF